MKNLKLTLLALTLLLPLTAFADINFDNESTLKAGRLGTGYEVQLNVIDDESLEPATGATCELVYGELPDGLSLSEDCTIFGTVNETITASYYKFKVKASYSYDDDEDEYVTVESETEFTITIKPRLEFKTDFFDLPYGRAGQDSYTAQIELDGVSVGDSLTFEFDNQAGWASCLNINQNTGEITGTLPTAGRITASIKVTDEDGYVAINTYDGTYVKWYGVDVLPEELAITTSTTINAVVGEEFSVALTSSDDDYASGFTDINPTPLNIEWSFEDFPSWVSYDHTTHQLSGTPTETELESQPYTFTATVKNTDPEAESEPITFTINVEAAAVVQPTPEITTPSPLPNGTVGAFYSQQLSAIAHSGGTITWSTVSSTISTYGVSLSSSGLISGTPVAAGNFSITVRATDDGNSLYTDKSFYIYINPAAPTPIGPTINVPSTPAIGRVGTSTNTWTFSSDQAVKWSVSAGFLPNGLSFENVEYYATTNRIVGTPTETGNFTFTIQVENEDGSRTTRAFNIGIAPAAPTAPFAARTDGMLWMPDVSKFPGLQAQVPELVNCKNNNPDCSAITGGYWFSYGSNAPKPQIKLDGLFVEFADGIALTDEFGNSRISEDGMELKMHIDANSAPNVYPVVAAAFSFRGDEKATDIYTNNSNRGYCIEYESDGEVQLEMAWPTNPDDPDGYPYGYDTYRVTLRPYETYRNLSFSNFYNEGWGSIPNGRTISQTEATQFVIRIQSSPGSSTKDVNFKLKQLGWQGKCKVAPTIATSSLPDGIMGKYYSQDLYTSSYQYATWSFVGEKPAGLDLSPWMEGQQTYITGIPQKEGLNEFTLKVENDNGYSTKDFTINVIKPVAPNITGTVELTGYMGESYYAYLDANTIYAEWEYSGLPDGLEFYGWDSGTATIDGYPTKPGTFTLTVKAKNVSNTDTKTYNITIGGERYKPAIYSYVNDAYEGENFSGYLSSDRAANWIIDYANIPPGLKLYYSNGTEYDGGYTDYIHFGGIASTPSEYTFTVNARNSLGFAEEPLELSITVHPAAVPPQISYAYLQSQVYRGEDFYGYAYLPYNTAAKWSLEGEIPDGLELYYDDGREYDGGYTNRIEFGGTATQAARYSFNLIASNSAGRVSRSLSVTVNGPPIPEFNTSPYLTGLVSENGSWYLSANQNVTWSVVGSLPTLFTLDNYGQRSYTYLRSKDRLTKEDEGTYYVEIKIVNSYGEEKTQMFIIEVEMPPPPTITTTDYFEAIAGQYFSKQISANQTVIWSKQDFPSWLNLGNYGNNTYTYVYGTPQEAREYTFTLNVTNPITELTGTKTFTINVRMPDRPEIINTALQNGEKGVSYMQILEATDIARWSIVGGDGNLPPGLYSGYWSDDGTGYISGYPTEAGTYNFIIRAENAAGFDEKPFSITIIDEQSAPNVPSLSSIPTTMEVGQPYGGYYISVGRGANWSISGDVEQLGARLNNNGYSNYNYIYFNPKTDGDFEFTVTVENDVGSRSRTHYVTVNPPSAPPQFKYSDYRSTITNGNNFSGEFNSTRDAIWEPVGNIPPGLKLYSDWSGTEYDGSSYTDYIRIGGTSTTVGEYSFTLKISNPAGSNTMPLAISVIAPPTPSAPTITINGSSNAIVGRYESWSVSSDQSIVAWSITNNPDWLRLYTYGNSRYAEVYGTPPAAGEYTFTVTGTNSYGLSGSRTFRISVATPEIPTITTTSLPNGIKGEEYEAQLEASGDVEDWYYEGERMPPGLYIDYEGVIRGIPTATGTYSFSITLINSAGSSKKTLTITIEAEQREPQIVNSTVPSSGTVGREDWACFESIVAANWSLEGYAGALGLSVSNEYTNSVCGTIKPTAAGEYTFTIKASNLKGSDSKTFTINVTVPPPPPPPEITAGLDVGAVGIWYNQRLTSSPSGAEWSWVGGSLPPGIGLNSNGYITGIPTAAGEYTFLVSAVNVEDVFKTNSSSKWLTITIGQPGATSITTTSLYNGTVNVQYVDWLNSSPSGAEWSWVGGDLPPGVSLTSYGYIYGTPTTAGTYTFLVEAKTQTGGSVSKRLSITINEQATTAPTITTTSLDNGTVNVPYGYGLNSSPSGAEWSWIGGELPPGINLSSNGYITGKPTASGIYTFLAEATSISSGSDTKWFSITVYEDYEDDLPVFALNDGNEVVSTVIVETQLSCTAAGKVWENGTCRSKTSKESCEETEGYIWNGSSCRSVEEVACTDKGEVFVGQGLPCRAKTAMEVCISDGNIWEINTSTCRARTAMEACLAQGKIWENDACRAKTPKEVCDESGRYWIEAEGVCKTRSTYTSQIASARNILLSTASNTIMLSNLPTSTKVEVYNLQGKHIYTGNSENASTMKIPVQTGMYIVKAGSQKMRVVVK